MSTDTTASVSTHILDTSIGRPAEGVRVTLSARTGAGAPWAELGASRTDADGRCKDLPPCRRGRPTYGSISTPRRTSRPTAQNRRSKPRRSRTPPA